jgi:hypothetical protein
MTTLEVSERHVKAMRSMDKRIKALMRYLRDDVHEALKDCSWTRARNLVAELESTMDAWIAVEEVTCMVEDLVASEAQS